MSKLLLGKVDDFAEGEAKGFDPNGTGTNTFFIVKKNNSFYSYTDICPHYNNTTLPWKRHQYLDGATKHIVCAAHGALFEIDTGECIQGPCLGQKLNKLAIEISTENEILIELSTIKEFNL